MIAAQRQATPGLIVQADSSQQVQELNADGSPVLDIDGNPVYIGNAVDVLVQKAAELSNSGVLGTDIRNRVEAIAHQTDGKFFFLCLEYFQKMILLSFLVPETVLGKAGTSGSGDSNLNSGHVDLLKQVTRSQMVYVADSLIEYLMRPLIELNYGEQDDYGSIPVKLEENEDTLQLLDIIGRVATAGQFSNADLEVTNRLRNLAGITPLSSVPEPVAPPVPA
jgi:hypothetical protein